MAKKTESKPLPKVPLLDDQPGVKAAREKLSDISKRRNALNDEMVELHEKLKTAKPYNAAQAKASAILNGGEAEEDTKPAIHKRLSELKNEIRAHDTAVQMQQQVIQDAINAANFALQDEFKKLYEPMVKKTREAVLALVDALNDERRFKACLEGQGFSCRPNIDTPSRTTFGNITHDWRAGVARYLRAVETNYNLPVPDQYKP